MQDFFYTLAERLQQQLHGDELLTCWLSGEDSDFVRFNRAQIRQAGAVSQRLLTLQLIDRRRRVHAALQLGLSGVLDDDLARAGAQITALRAVLPGLPKDPHLCYAEQPQNSEVHADNELLPSAEISAAVLEAAQQPQSNLASDFVGILASGDLYRGFANSLGQRNWHGSRSFNLDFSLHRDATTAVKSGYAGRHWDDAELRHRVITAGVQLQRLAQPARVLKPGPYRVMLAPAAVAEIFDLLSYNAFGVRAQRTGHSPLRRLVDGEARLHPSVTLREATAEGIAPNVQSAGFMRPPAVSLIERGAHQNALISPRSAAEYGLQPNGADPDEAPQSLDLAAGELPQSEALAQLDRGLYIDNLWYLNYSDLNAGRITGMTRFATFWVEHGELQSPIEAMRFDDTLYRMFGDGLLGLTYERELLLDPGSYGGRSVCSRRLPGALIDALRFTL